MIFTTWRVELLGGFCLKRGDESVTHFRTRKAAALIAFLILHPQRHSRDALSDLLWPDADFDDARASFRGTLSHIRKALGTDFLQTTRDTVGIAAPFTCDATDFERAVNAKRWKDAGQLYRGELLPGFWDDWVLAERQRLETLFDTVQQKIDHTRPVPHVFLPEEPNHFFGREEEIGQTATLLGEHRLVTLLGPGGVGKTRLSIATARRHAALYPGGIWFVSLSDVREAERLLPTVRDVLGLPRDAKADPGDQIADRLSGESPCLLILDNFEQITPLGAPILASLIARVANLTCLVTSRRRLGLPGERQAAVAPLGEAASVALFCDRAQTAAVAETADLCRDLEGIPLSIELCAARAGVFTIAEMRAQLTNPFTLLSSSDSDKSSRHRSLFAAIQWSYGLLTTEQRQFFARLSAFRGGWTLEAAESICEERSVAEYLSQLRERSLLVAEETEGRIRFRLLESLRSFAQGLFTPDERAELHKRHLEYYLSFAKECHTRLDSVDTAQALDRLEADHDNFRAALDRSDSEGKLRLVAQLWKFWEIRGHFSEGRQRIAAALAVSSGGGDTRAQALSGLGALAYAQGDHETALSAQEEAIGIARDGSVAAKARNNRALILLRLGRLTEAEQSFADARDFFVAAGNRVGESATLSNLGIVRRRLGDFEGARSALEAAIRLDRDVGNQQSLAFALNGLALVEARSGQFDEAERHFTESLAIKRALNDRAGIVSALANLGTLATEQSKFALAMSLQSEALVLRIELGLQHGILESLGGFSLLASATGEPIRAATLLGAQVAL
ncbi:MAG: tetratricopeptide repeat protein, partial [Akkermansiaceae bacterium]|nr:tetratricopeptide repeat protein [Armatimonadota bacterium]